MDGAPLTEPLELQAVEGNRGELRTIEKEPTVGLEPTTYALRKNCSPTTTPDSASIYATDSTSGAATGAVTPTDPELARVVEAWPTLPEPLRRAVLALVGTADPSTQNRSAKP